MPGTTWTKWFWSDWMTDKGLRACSLAARGLWMDMLCIAAEADPPGYVSVNGNGLDAKGIASIVGKPVEEIQPLLDELFHSGVYSVNRSGVIFSRRIIRDEKRRQASAKGGKSGGRQAVENKRGIFSTPDPTPDPTPRGTPDATPHPMEVNHKPEARKEDSIESKSTTPRATAAWGAAEKYERLVAAARGWVDEQSSNIVQIKAILDLEAMGCDFALDVLPVVAENVPLLSDRLRSWGARWLRDAVIQHREERLRKAGVTPLPGKTLPKYPTDAQRWEAMGPQETLREQTARVRYWLQYEDWHRDWHPPPDHPDCPIPHDVLVDIVTKFGKPRDLTRLKRPA